MKYPTPQKTLPGFFVSLLLLAATFFNVESAQACSSGGCGGCRLDHIQKNPAWMAFYKASVAKGIKPIACFRTYQCQVNLRRTCGGRADPPGRSLHETGIAMDFRTSNGDAQRVKPLARAMLPQPVRQCMHGGVGWHVSNSTHQCSAFRTNGKAVKQYLEEKASEQKKPKEQKTSSAPQKKTLSADLGNSSSEQANTPPPKPRNPASVSNLDPSHDDFPCINLSCVPRNGRNGKWYRRRSGEWVRMTWYPIRR